MVSLSSSAPAFSLPGQLYLYAAGRATFESPLITQETAAATSSEPQQQHRPKKCILIGGLSDGLLPVPYTQALYEQAIVTTDDWSLVQPILSSSYLGFGNCSLERDSQELDELFAYLMQHRHAETFCLVGHSTGCQNAIHYLKHGTYKHKLQAVALQAPVSDREHAQMEPDYVTNLQVAEAMRSDGRANEMMPRSAFWAPITAQRFLDLQKTGGADDLFSSDYTDEQLMERLGHVSEQQEDGARRVLVAFSGADEYVPAKVNSKVLLDRLTRAMNAHCDDDKKVAYGLYLPDANHNLSEAPGDAETFVQAVSELLHKV